jgi:ribonuclease E
MPNTARGGGISRKITNAADRKKLKAIANEIDVPEGAGLIVRTAGAKRTRTEIKRDYEYLQRLWEQIRKLTLESIAPAKIYEEGNLIKRSIRDLYNRDIDEVLVEGEAGYRVAKDFMKMIMPSHAKNVKLYNETLPLFARFQVESYLAGMFNPTVQLKSGGYIVIGVTEALVAIDVNSGRATKQGSIEETALNTNLEASDEVARQLRLRDLAGLIVIDYIDMEERRNNTAVEKRLKDKLKTDRARIQVGRISGFGLMEMSRQRLRPGMIEATTQPCSHCHGTGLIRSDENLALSILRQIEEEGTRGRSREVVLKAPIGISNYLVNNKREHIARIEIRYGLSVRVEGDPFMVSPDFSLEKLKTASRVVKRVAPPVVSVDASIMDGIDEAINEDAEAEAVEQPSEQSSAQPSVQPSAPTPVQPAEGDGQAPKKRRRRRRRRRGGSGEDQSPNNRNEAQNGQDTDSDVAKPAEDKPDAEAPADGGAVDVQAAIEADAADPVAEEKAKKAPRKRRARKPKVEAVENADAPAETVKTDVPADDAPASDAPEASEAEEKPKKKPVRRRKTTVKKAKPAVEGEVAEDEVKEEAVEEKPKRKRAPRKTAAKKPAAKKPATRKPVKKAEEVAVDAPVIEPAAEPALQPVPEPVVAPVVEPAPVAGPAPVVEPVPEPAPGPAPAEKSEADKPKKKGWWSLGR